MTPFEQLNAFNRSFERAKDCYKQMQRWYVSNKPKRHYYPMQKTPMLDVEAAMAYECLSPEDSKHQEAIKVMSCLYLFGTWRNTLGVYILDDEIAQDCKPLPDDTPTSIFYNLPEWCVYISTEKENIVIFDENEKLYQLKGFWAIYDVVETGKGTFDAINFIQDLGHNNHAYIPSPFFISNSMSIADSFALNKSINPEEGPDNMIEALLPFLLWLCVAEPDITYKQEPVSREKLTQPKYGINKKTGTFIPPNEPFIYEIGARLGGEIRKYKEKIDDYEKENKTKSSKKRPHIRRGHWHGYWHGTGQAKEFRVKWLPAVFVNG